MSIRLTWYIFENTALIVFLYYGFIEDISGFKNLAVFIGWLTGAFGTIIVLAFIVDSPQMQKSIAKSGYSPPVPYTIDILFDLVVLFIFVWFSHYWLASFYFMSILASIEVRKAPKIHMERMLRDATKK